jgi:glycosyltransferase involved in cell wall biosynthesis
VLFVGGGPMEARLRQWCKQKGERAAKILTGVSHDRVPNVLNGIDIGVVPSQSTPRWKEQLGRILIEFMASGVPVIASDSGEIPYVVGGSGLISPESDQNAWMNALTGLVDDAEARRKLAAAGLDHARAHYDWAKVAARFVRFFETVADRRRV